MLLQNDPFAARNKSPSVEHVTSCSVHTKDTGGGGGAAARDTSANNRRAATCSGRIGKLSVEESSVRPRLDRRLDALLMPDSPATTQDAATTLCQISTRTVLHVQRQAMTRVLARQHDTSSERHPR